MTIKYNEILSLDQLLESIKNEWDCADLVNQTSKKISEIVLFDPFDAHLHLRTWGMLEVVSKLSARNFYWWIIMPNLVPVIETLDQVLWYKQEIKDIILKEDYTQVNFKRIPKWFNSIWENNFIPHMTVNFNPNFTREQLEELKPHIIWVKMYPKWQTTNSEKWVNSSEIDSYSNVLKILEELEIPLLIHWEIVDWWDKVDELDKERKFAPIYEKLAQNYQKLKIIMEHVSTKEVLALLNKYENLYATVTIHHLLLIHNHIIWWWTKPHLMCMPIPKLWDDRKEILRQVLSWNPKIMFGSDSAPHSKNKKESADSCSWIFTAPIALQVLVEIFDSFWELDKLQKFVSGNAKEIYWLNPIVKKSVKLITKENIVLESYWQGDNTIVPFLDWRKLKWDINNIF